jgi:hypothetical protein
LDSYGSPLPLEIAKTIETLRLGVTQLADSLDIQTGIATPCLPALEALIPQEAVVNIYDKSAVLLLEQPEDGIHTGVLHKLIPLLKSYTGQFLIASHSSEIFNRMEPEEIRLVTMENGVTQLRPLDATEIAAASRFIREEGTLSDFIETIQED